ncbi:MAG TPA: hypothetical protein VIE67_10935 [Rudaea sp.]|jgi:hypothetical protein|uniref:hypothetical protein n=1 Tax=Rudaea sp. TaxID=2136325 RepID=UPI002F959975
MVADRKSNELAEGVLQRKAYAAPLVVLYGAVTDLTAAGSGSSKEGINGGGNCNQSPRKAHC